ncbi:MAG: dihydropteroate synthase, partial [Bacteroidota bacterium]|nr:dihydropteroate synthase [Bacteroidota bacterium]
MIINCNSTTIDLYEGHVMGVLNVTPDSFYDGGKYKDLNSIVSQAKQMLEDGATFIDIGGASTKPGADVVDEKEEINRVIPVINAIKQHAPKAIISIDTTSSVVAEKAVTSGASIVNDISAGTFDERMLAVVASLGIPYIAMHIQGTPKTMQINPTYDHVVDDVFRAMESFCDRAIKQGIKQIIIDPGFGFGKTLSHNYQLLNHLDKFQSLGHPILVGASRKSMIQKPINVKAENALNGTTVVNTIAALQGASILRVHDVKEAVQVFKIVNYM